METKYGTIEDRILNEVKEEFGPDYNVEYISQANLFKITKGNNGVEFTGEMWSYADSKKDFVEHMKYRLQ